VLHKMYRPQIYFYDNSKINMLGMVIERLLVISSKISFFITIFHAFLHIQLRLINSASAVKKVTFL